MQVWLKSVILGMGLWPMAALSWNPYPDVSAPPPEERHWSRPSQTTTPYRAPLMRSAPVYRAPVSYAAPAPAYTPPAPTYTPPPVYTPPAQTAYVPPPAPAAPMDAVRRAPVNQYAPVTAEAPPAYTPPPAENESSFWSFMDADDDAGQYREPPKAQYGYTAAAAEEDQASTHHFAIGVDYFQDRYDEPTLGVITEGDYFSLLGEYDFYSRGMSDIYLGADLRASMGESNYASSSGRIDSIPETEYEGRLKVGLSTIENGRGFVPYTGVGVRYYRMDGKGEVTDLGAGAYDRNILQVYLPLGVNAHTYFGSWNVKGTLEYDHLLAGYVSSRLENVPAAGIENLMNHQDSGFAIRAEFLMGQTYANGLGFAFGPYLRYWDVDDSDVDQYGFSGMGGMEPENTRLQTGMKVKMTF